MSKRKIAVVLMSGGMDSALCAAIAQKQGYSLAAMHLDYRQRTEERERRAFSEVADYYGITQRLVVDVSYLSQIGGSSLTDSTIDVQNAAIDSDVIPKSYVPFRNANLLAIAVSWAEVLKAEAIFIGATQADFSGYPDCRKVFFDAFQKTIEFGTRPETIITIQTPILDMTKSEIVMLGVELNVPFHLTWSCYKSSDKACGTCDSCALRLRGFEQAGIVDPIDYEN